MLSGYIPGAEAVGAVGDIAKELKRKTKATPGRFFWVLDPVMGDNGKLYVADDCVPAYKALIPYADLILPNQFEAEYASYFQGLKTLLTWNRLLSGVKITDMDSLTNAIQVLHDTYHIPHVVITSVKILAPDVPNSHLSVVGSTMTSTGRVRLFKIIFPAIDCYFSGTGDMFAALMVIRMRQAVSSIPGLSEKASWLSGDDAPTLELPLVRAAETVLASMHELLSRTSQSMEKVVERTTKGMSEEERKNEGKMDVVRSKGAELQLVRNLECLRAPEVQFRAKTI